MQLGGSPIRGRGELPCAVVGALLCPCGGGGCMAAGPAQQHAKRCLDIYSAELLDIHKNWQNWEV
jgi:hypothetical protein